MMDVVCCEHNLCPHRPTWWLSRFQNRPWYDPQCGRMWMTEWVSSYAGGSYQWYEVMQTKPAIEKDPIFGRVHGK